MEGSFTGLNSTSFPLFIEIKNQEDGLAFADASLSQQIELILENTPVEVNPPSVVEDDDDDSNIEIGDLLKYNKKVEEPKVDIGATTKSTEIYNCAECSESFDSKEIYDIHMSGHANNMKCAICNMVLKSLKNYEKHCLRCKPYECQICGRIVRFRPNFIKHMRVHTTQQSQRHKYKCDVCHKEFMSFEYFKVHKKIHNGNINLTCGVCGKVFSALASLRGHSKLHTGIKLHKCDVCGKGFGQRYNLKIHSRVHTGETPFECKICKRKLNTQSSYQTHMQTHHSSGVQTEQQPQQQQQQQQQQSSTETISIKEEHPVTTHKTDMDDLTNVPDIILAEVKSSPACQEEPLNIAIKVKQEPVEDDDNTQEHTLKSLSEQIKIKIEKCLEESSKVKIKTEADNDNCTIDAKYHESDFENDLIDSNDLANSLSYSNLFDPGSISESIPDDIYMEDNDSSFQLDQNSLDLQSTTDGNFIKKEWVYSSNYSVAQKFDDEEIYQAASFIYD